MRASRRTLLDSLMDITATLSRISRVNLRYRHGTQDVVLNKEPAQKEKDEVELADYVDEPLLKREQKGRQVMTRAHRMFHRRAAVEPSQTLTVVVDVVATVGSDGSTIVLATSTPGLVSTQSVSNVVLPSVPAVPPFPSDLTVPAYPWPSGVSTAQLSTSSLTSSSTSSLSILPTLTSTSSSTTSGARSAISTILPSSLSSNSTISTSLLSTSVSSTQNATSIITTSSSSSSLHFSSVQSSTQILVTSSNTPQSTSLLGGGGGDPVNTALVPAATTVAPDSSQGDSTEDSALTTPKVVGSVIGSLAGAALFLVIILFLIKRHKRKPRVVIPQITADDAADNQPMATAGQQMATRRSYVPANTAAFFNRLSGASRSTAETSTTGGGERGFQRISGRKLPSAFSEGMTSDQFAREGTLSGSSFYHDDSGFHGGRGLGEVSAAAAAAAAVGAKERVVTMPSPARTPKIYHSNQAPPPFGENRNGGSMISPPQSPNPSLRPIGTLGRSHPSQDGSRNSKFTEDV